MIRGDKIGVKIDFSHMLKDYESYRVKNGRITPIAVKNRNLRPFNLLKYKDHHNLVTIHHKMVHTPLVHLPECAEDHEKAYDSRGQDDQVSYI